MLDLTRASGRWDACRLPPLRGPRPRHVHDAAIERIAAEQRNKRDPTTWPQPPEGTDGHRSSSARDQGAASRWPPRGVLRAARPQQRRSKSMSRAAPRGGLAGGRRGDALKMTTTPTSRVGLAVAGAFLRHVDW